jgi:hypothetical protein
MLSRFTTFLSGTGQPARAASLYQQRLAVYQRELGEPEHSFVDTDPRYALIATECDAAPRVLECRPEVEEAIELCRFWFGG